MILLSFQENFGVFNWKTNDGLLSWRPMNFNYPCLVVTLRRNSVAGAKPPCDAAYGEPHPGPGLTLAMAEVSLNLRNNVNQPLINNMLKNGTIVGFPDGAPRDAGASRGGATASRTDCGVKVWDTSPQAPPARPIFPSIIPPGMVEPSGIEPLTSSLRTRRSTN